VKFPKDVIVLLTRDSSDEGEEAEIYSVNERIVAGNGSTKELLLQEWLGFKHITCELKK